MELLKFIKIGRCAEFDFLDDLTMLVTYFDQNCVKKYTRTDQSAFDWIEDGSIEIDTPIQLKCIDKDIYVVSRW